MIVKDGKVNQVDIPMNLYNKPVDQFVAGFIGRPAMNFIDVNVSNKNTIIIKNGKLKFYLNVEQKNHIKDYFDKEIKLGIRL